MNLGETFPNFKAKTTQGDIDFHDWIGDSWVILFSHPADFTPVCTTELARAAALVPEFKKRNVKLIALSCDSVKSHHDWIDDIKAYGSLSSDFPYPIIDDESRELAVKFNMLDKDEIGKAGLPLTCRAVFIVDPLKKFRLSILYPATTGRNFDEILRVIDSMQLTDCNKVATPADWKPKEFVMVLPTVKDEELASLYPNGVEVTDVPSENCNFEMETFFNLNHKLVFNKKDDVFGRFESICKIASTNLVAYTSEVDIFTAEKGFHLFLFDVNLPWSAYKVASRKYPITVIEWDQSGCFLLVADNYGNISVYAMENNLISEWHEIHSVCFPGENIISAKFFHNGIKIPKYQQDKRDQVLYADKYLRPKFQPTVRKFGGVSDFGCIIITSTGLVGAFSVDTNSTPGANNNNNSETCQATKSLGQSRNLCTLADISFNNGQFYVAVVNTAQKNPIVQCYRVQIEKIDEENLTIVSKSLPSFFINESAATKDMVDLKMLRLKWMTQEDSDSLIISSNHSGGSIVEIWSLKEEQTPILKVFQTNKSESYKSFVWSNQQNYKHSRKVLDVITTKVQFAVNFYIFIAYQDSSIHCLNREGLKRVAITNLHLTTSLMEHPTKKIKTTSKVSALDISCLGHMLIASDSIGQISCYRVNFDHIMNNAVHSVNLLEFCMISGLDALDSMLMLKPQMIDMVVDKLTDNFNRQPNHVTQFYYIKFLTMKINLYRLSSFGQSKAHDLVCLLNLISISTAFKSLLRPADLMTTKNGPAENLAMNLSESSLPDVDKVLLNLEAKDFTVEPSTLQSLQQLIQFVADLALNILSKLPEGRTFLNTNKTTGDLSDFTALNSIRELLVMIRIWGLLRPQCLPVFSRSADNLDILATLFRLLTKLAPKPTEPEDQLLDECCLLPNQVLIPQIQLNTPRTSLSSPLLVNEVLPLQLEYNVEFDSLDFTPELHYVEGCLMNNSIIDSIRYIQLGKNSINLRRCSRCGSYSSLKTVARTAAMKGWELRWNTCKCGGFWKLEKA